MKIGILGTGDLATTLGSAWAAAGHSIVITGRNDAHARAAARAIGPAATDTDPAEFAAAADAVVVAVPWNGLVSALRLVGATVGSLAGTTVIDCTNPVEYATGQVLPASGSAAELVARTATGANVVKALHLFAGASWPYSGEADRAPVVAVCGDDAGALALTGALIEDLGGRAVAVGALDASRQLEEAAGFVMRVVGAGANPRLAVPDVDPALFATANSAG
jgi:predicted dinucleotide-binding enzyme